MLYRIVYSIDTSSTIQISQIRVKYLFFMFTLLLVVDSKLELIILSAVDLHKFQLNVLKAYLNHMNSFQHSLKIGNILDVVL